MHADSAQTRAKPKTILLTAYAKAPTGTSMYEVYKHVGIVLEVDPRTHRILDAEFTFVTELAQRFFRSLVIGYDLSQGVEGLVRLVEERYWAPSQKALVMALRSAYQRYAERVGLNPTA